MPKYYINEKRQCFLVSNNYMHEQLSPNHAKEFLESLPSLSLVTAEINGDSIKGLFNNNDTVTFDSKAFGKFGDNYDHYIEDVKNKIIEVLKAKFKNDTNFKKYVAKLPKGFIPSVNRRKEMGTLIVSGALATMAILYALMPNLKEANSHEEVFTPEIPMGDLLLEVNSFPHNFIPEHNQIVAASEEVIAPIESTTAIVAFDVATPEDYKKLETVTNNCAPFIEPYIERYNLPRELMYCLLCQEDGALDPGERANGGIGPMQIQKGQMDGEYFEVPVYENGILTGEYDRFYVVDNEEDRNKPEYAGYEVLVTTNLEDNFKIGCGYTRRGIDRYESIYIGLDSYNKGLYAFSNVFNNDYVTPEHEREYYQENMSDFSWINFIANHYKIKNNDPNYVYGDPNYIWNVLKYMNYDETGTTTITYDCKGKLYSVKLTNANLVDKTLDNDYNNGQTRG